VEVIFSLGEIERSSHQLQWLSLYIYIYIYFGGVGWGRKFNEMQVSVSELWLWLLVSFYDRMADVSSLFLIVRLY
jgi:hypothetical protein